MHLSDYAAHDATGLNQLIQAKQVSADEVRSAALQAIEALNPQVNALVETWRDGPSPPAGEFTGVPVLIKALGITANGRPSELASAWALGFTAEGRTTERRG